MINLTELPTIPQRWTVHSEWETSQSAIGIANALKNTEKCLDVRARMEREGLYLVEVRHECPHNDICTFRALCVALESGWHIEGGYPLVYRIDGILRGAIFSAAAYGSGLVYGAKYVYGNHPGFIDVTAPTTLSEAVAAVEAANPRA